MDRVLRQAEKTAVGPRLRWRARRLKPMLRPPVVYLRHRHLGPDDVVIGEYPKSGSTWLAFMVGEVLLDRPIDFDTQEELVPALVAGIWPRDAPRALPGGGRLYRSHEPHRREYRRAICVVRHVADVAVSYHNWLAWQGVPTPDVDRFLRMFLQGRVGAYGSWQDHVQSWLEAREATIELVRYEDLKAQPHETVMRVLRFAGAEPDPACVARAVESNTVGRMRAKEDRARRGPFSRHRAGKRFVSRGGPGGALEWLTDEDFALIDRYAGPTLRRLGYSVRPEVAAAR
jgi:hypothetical protein